MGVALRLEGQTFGLWTVVRQDPERRFGSIAWLCRCKNGHEISILGFYLKQGYKTPCKECDATALIGQSFGRLTVQSLLGVFPRTKNPEKRQVQIRKWRCICSCGGTKDAFESDLLTGRAVSCRCLLREKNRKHRTIHGLHSSPEYRAWTSAKVRCYDKNNPQWEHYGGRGITVCDRWRTSFKAFIEDMGLKPSAEYSLDRINNSGNYEPGNCRWATRSEQGFNRRLPSRLKKKVLPTLMLIGLLTASCEGRL